MMKTRSLIHWGVIASVLLLCLLITSTAGAFEEFVAKRVAVKGNHRVSQSTIMSYLSIQQGDRITPQDTSSILSELYSTGFFERIALARDDHTLIIRVKEHPVVSKLNIKGNSLIKTEQIQSVLDQAGINEGEMLNPANLEAVKQSLLQQYYNQGHYTADVKFKTQHITKSRIAVTIDIDEGEVATIAQIKMIGNHQYADSTLLKNFQLEPASLWTYLSSRDQYSRQKLKADMKKLSHYYMDRGYLNFKIKGVQVSITPDKKHVYIVIKVDEGKPFKVGEIKLKGQVPEDVDKQALWHKITVKQGQWFSRNSIVQSEQAMGNYLANQGYANAQIYPKPKRTQDPHTVNIHFHLQPNNHVYINRIQFKGHHKTQDQALRKQLRQPEAGLLRDKNIKETKRRMNNFGFVKNVDINTKEVTANPSLKDLTYTIQEQSSAQFSVQVAFSDTYGVMYGADLTDKNFRGTGKHVSLSLNRNSYLTDFNLDYYNPNYTLSGISRGFNIHSSRQTPDRIKLSDYTLDKIGGKVTYGIPLTEYSHLDSSLLYDRYVLNLSSDASNEIKNFKNKHGTRFNGFEAKLDLRRSTLDRAIFPTQGTKQQLNFTLGMPFGDEALEFYKARYQFHGWQPLYRDFILHGRATLGYGDGYGELDDLPFFLNYYAGGIHSVRGYEGNTLGPVDSTGRPIGGRALSDFSLGLVFPTIKDSVRVTAFVDGGNVFENTYQFDDLRYSVGVQAQWYSPIGPFIFSFAEPINPADHNDTEKFQFSLGTSFSGT